MSLERIFRKLSLQPHTLCRQCRRTVASSRPGRQQPQSATGAFAELLQTSRDESTAESRRSTVRRTADFSSKMNPTPPESTADQVAERSSFDFARQAIRNASSPANKRRKEEQNVLRMQKMSARSDLERQAIRRWKLGDVYAPHDLSGVEQSKWKKVHRKTRRKSDVMDQLRINPLDHYKNLSIMSEYMTDMGRIKHSRESGLRPVNQRRMAKAIRRAIGIGLMPGVHRHPEVLMKENVLR